jgi:methylphosphotriester-DNA--protein-cysteine methyltransferase
MSPGHFARRFRAAYGVTPYVYLMTRRIERAKALLRRGDVSVTDACMHRLGRIRPSLAARSDQQCRCRSHGHGHQSSAHGVVSSR